MVQSYFDTTLALLRDIEHPDKDNLLNNLRFCLSTVSAPQSATALGNATHTDCLRNNGCFSDSGYSSAPPDALGVNRSVNMTSNMSETTILELSRSKEDNEDGMESNLDSEDCNSIYSDATDVTTSTKDQYITELVDDLVDNILMKKPSSEIQLEELCAYLPGLLKAFARTIGFLGESRQSRDVMVFVSKYR
ncbi:hypothetical protein K505DRAFT_405543, partial [Melanomma pulvis-pyrius CBS 109.77]